MNKQSCSHVIGQPDFPSSIIHTRLISVAVLFGAITLALLWSNDAELSVQRTDDGLNVRIAFSIIHYGKFNVLKYDKRSQSYILTSRPYMRMEPGYPLYLAMIFATVPEFYSLSIGCLLDDECDAAAPVRRRVQHVSAFVSAVAVVATFVASYYFTASWPLSIAAGLACLPLLPYRYSGTALIALFLLGHAVLASATWRRPRVTTGILSGVALGLLVLTEAVFQYWLVLIAMILGAACVVRGGKRRRMLIPAFSAMLLVALVLTLPWMVRNQVQHGQFNITSRDTEILAIRAEFGRMTWPEVRGAFAYYLPKNTIPFGRLRLLAMDWLEPAPFGYARLDRKNPEGFYKRAKSESGEVAARADLLTPEWRLDYRAGKNIALKQAALALIYEDWLKHVVLTAVFAVRGSIYPCYKFGAATKTYGNMIGVPIKIMCTIAKCLTLLFLPALGLLCAIALRRRSFALVLLSLPVYYAFGFHAAVTHFIPRYSAPLVPLFVVVLALAVKEVLSWTKNREWRMPATNSNDRFTGTSKT